MAKLMTLIRSPDDIEENNCKLVEFHFNDGKMESLYQELTSGVVPGEISSKLLSLAPRGLYIVSVASGEFGEENFRETDIELRIVH